MWGDGYDGGGGDSGGGGVGEDQKDMSWRERPIVEQLKRGKSEEGSPDGCGAICSHARRDARGSRIYALHSDAMLTWAGQ